MNTQRLNAHRRTLALTTLVGLSFLLGLGGAARAGAATASSPTFPVPGNAPPAPPPIPAPPAASATPPPADQITDPVTPSASCSGWSLQTRYGSRWATTSSWWEYQCVDDQYPSYDPCQVGACDAFCPYCWEQIQNTTDYFYWDGSSPVFYGEEYYYLFDYPQTDNPAQVIDAWWDAPTAEWWDVGPFPLEVSTAGSGSGAVTETPQGQNICTLGSPDCAPSFDAGTLVTLSAAADPGSTFSGWSGDCSGTGPCQLTMSQARSVTVTFTPSNFSLAVSKQGTGTGLVSSNPAGISCGGTCQASFTGGNTVTLNAALTAGSVFAGWSGDCTGKGACQLTMSQARSVTATFATNQPPQASFTLTCVSLTCNFDATGSSDPDDAIANYTWNFGDGTAGNGLTISHMYPKAGSYTATLTVTDNAGASTSTSKAFNPISLSARGYKQNGAEKIELSWNTPGAANYDIYRNNNRIATLRGGSYTDTVTGRGPFTYKVCAPSTSTCSNQTSVTF
jgi:hypothetical protein